MLKNAPPGSPDIDALKARATRLRRHMLSMARGQGQGYIGQGLGIAELLTALYFHEMRYDPENVKWPDRDRFLLSTGHYSIGLWAALAEVGIIPVDELSTYGADGSRLQMSTLDTTPGVEVIGGSLGQGLGQAVGQALGLRLRKSDARVFVYRLPLAPAPRRFRRCRSVRHRCEPEARANAEIRLFAAYRAV